MTAEAQVKRAHLTGDMAGIFDALAGATDEVTAMRLTLALAARFSGTYVYIQKLERIKRLARNEQMRKEERQGLSPKELALKFGLTESAVREIVYNKPPPTAELEFNAK